MELLVRAVEDDDVELAAIAAATADPDGSVATDVRARFDAIANVLKPKLGERVGSARVRALLRVFYRDLAFHAPDDYGDPRLHEIGCVLDRRVGSPVALAVALIGVGRRAGVELEPVAFPGHFLVRAVLEKPVLIDPCSGAMPIPEDRLTDLAVSELGLTRAAVETLWMRASARAVAVRILENLEQCYSDRGDRARALLVSERLLTLGGPAATARRMVASVIRTFAVEKSARARRRLIVHREGLSFRLDDEPAIDLRRRRALPLLLKRLVEHHRTKATHGLAWPALIEAGWPGELIQSDAAWARLRTAIRTLRKLGLADVLITIGTGYLLDPSCDVTWE